MGPWVGLMSKIWVRGLNPFSWVESDSFVGRTHGPTSPTIRAWVRPMPRNGSELVTPSAPVGTLLDFGSRGSRDRITCSHKPGVRDRHTDRHTDRHRKCQPGLRGCAVRHCRRNRFLAKEADKGADPSPQEFRSSEISSISFVYVLLKLRIYCVEPSITLRLAIFITLSSTLYEALATGFTFWEKNCQIDW